MRGIGTVILMSVALAACSGRSSGLVDADAPASSETVGDSVSPERPVADVVEQLDAVEEAVSIEVLAVDVVEQFEDVEDSVSVDVPVADLQDTYFDDNSLATDTCGNCPDDGEEIPCGGDQCLDTLDDEAAAPLCGNGILDLGEECDDGNTENGDCCSEWCMTEGTGQCLPVSDCGNGLVEPWLDEECDDGNAESGDGCDEWCQFEGTGLCSPMPCCGDGFVTAGEQCDDGNLDNGDGCSDECKVEDGLGGISGVVTFAGEVTEDDSFVVYLSTAPIEDLNVVKESKYKPVEFPVNYTMSNVWPGTYYVVALFDKNDDAWEVGVGEGDVIINYADEENPVPVTVGAGEDVIDIDIDLGP